jgi:diguanylate cyclase (GGDEF)-like protein
MSELISEARMLAALSATNEAVLRAHSSAELFQRVCEAAVDGGGLCLAAALLPDSEGFLRFVAQASHDGRPLDAVISTDADRDHGQGLAGAAFRTGRTQISNDSFNDERLKPWRQPMIARSLRSAVAVPIRQDDASAGVFLFYFTQRYALGQEVIAHLERMAANVSFGLISLERKQQNDRISRMLHALSTTNEAIIRAKTRDELFQMVCDAAVSGARFTSTTIFLSVEGDDFFHRAAIAGPLIDKIRSRRYAKTADRPEGKGLTGTAFRTGEPCIRNDFEAHERAINWIYDNSANRTAKAAACLPLFGKNGIVGVMLFMAAEKNTFTPELIELLQRLVENLSFGLENFDRADEKRRAEDRAQYLATHDVLTGLPNRMMFTELLEHSVKLARRDQRKNALLFADLDGFKFVNDSLGHAAGDELLVQVGSRLRSCLRESDVVARLGGDEFVVILNDVGGREQTSAVARKILDALAAPVELVDRQCCVGASIGIAICPDDGDSAELLLRNADEAMYEAKDGGKNDFRFFRQGKVLALTRDASEVPAVASPPLQAMLDTSAGLAVRTPSRPTAMA